MLKSSITGITQTYDFCFDNFTRMTRGREREKENGTQSNDIDIRHFLPLSDIAYDRREKNIHILEIYTRDHHVLKKRCASNAQNFLST